MTDEKMTKIRQNEPLIVIMMSENTWFSFIYPIYRFRSRSCILISSRQLVEPATLFLRLVRLTINFQYNET
jgi:hypothetical protein